MCLHPGPAETERLGRESDRTESSDQMWSTRLGPLVASSSDGATSVRAAERRFLGPQSDSVRNMPRSRARANPPRSASRRSEAKEEKRNETV